MKRSVGGGAHRGPVAPARQRRTLRLMQAIFVALAAGLLLLAGYNWGRAAGFDEGRSARGIDASAPPSPVQTVVLAALGAGSLAAAFLLQKDGAVRMPTPAKLDALAGRAEQAMVEKAEELAEADRSERA